MRFWFFNSIPKFHFQDAKISIPFFLFQNVFSFWISNYGMKANYEILISLGVGNKFIGYKKK